MQKFHTSYTNPLKLKSLNLFETLEKIEIKNTKKSITRSILYPRTLHEQNLQFQRFKILHIGSMI